MKPIINGGYILISLTPLRDGFVKMMVQPRNGNVEERPSSWKKNWPKKVTMLNSKNP